MRNNKFIAWLLIVCIVISTFSTSMTVSYADAGGVDSVQSIEGTSSQISHSLTGASVTSDVYTDVISKMNRLSVQSTLNATLSAKEQLDNNLAYLLKTVDKPTFGTGGGEWSILSLARANYSVPDDYYEIYYNNVVTKVRELMVKNSGKLDKNKGTEHARLMMALTALGKDIDDVGGYAIKNALADYQYVTRQGINGPIFALIALDSNHYDIPIDASVKIQTTREMLIDYILAKEISVGGWALSGTVPDPDITGMAIQGLTPYYETQQDVKDAVDRAIVWLSQAQKDEGGYASWGSINSESIAQVVVAVTGLGIDPHTDSRFIKNGYSAIDALLSFAVPEGGFLHIKPGATGNGGAAAGKVDGMATDQGTYALVAYDRLVNGQQGLYDMTDVQGTQPEVPPVTPEVPPVTPEVPPVTPEVPPVTPEVPPVTSVVVVPLPSVDQPKVDILNNDQDYIIPITTGDNNKEIMVDIPSDKNANVFVNLPSGSNLPKLEATKGNVSVMIPKGTQVTSGDSSALRLISSVNMTEQALRDQIGGILPKEKKLDEIVRAFSMGGSARVEFNSFITLTFKGMQGKDAAYIQGGLPYTIQKYASDEEGLNSGKSEFAYDRGNDLIVRTNHFTDFIAYASSAKDTTGAIEEVFPELKSYVTLSVDKLTINKGYVVAAITVELQPGDTAWTVLRRELDKRNIGYDSSWTEKFGSIYVESIAGDGEFDHGSGSGWMYNVNGWYPNYGASSYILNDGDRLQWRYTTDLGADLGEDLSQWDQNSEGQLSLAEGIVIQSDDKTPVINVPKDISKDYTLNILKELKNTTNITINIPNVQSKVLLNLADVKDAIPMITVVKMDTTVVIEKGTQLKTGDPKIELMTSVDTNTTTIPNLIKGTLKENEKLEKLNQVFVMGNGSNQALFDKPVTFIFKGGKEQLPGFIEGNTFTPITMYNTEENGIQATKGNVKQTYAFIKGNDLYLKTNVMTTLVSYTVSKSNVVYTVDVVNPIDLKKIYTDANAISLWAYEAIGVATQNGFIQGNNGKFNPKSNITRAEFTKIVATVLGLDLTLDKSITFKDVASDDWFYPYVNAAYKAGFITGFNHEFNPNDKITREQMAATIVRALGIKSTSLTTELKDINSISAWARTDVETIIALELMVGSDSQFRPKDYVTREMAAVVATRAYDYKNGNKGSDVVVGKVEHQKVKETIQDTAVFLQKAVPDPVIASVGGEWTVFGLARSGVSVPDAYYAKYYANVVKILNEKSGKLHNVKYTEYDRVILALTSIGRDIDDVAGYNLRKPLADFDTLIKQGINGPIFALIALDSNHYEILTDPGVKTQTTRDMLIDFILKREINGGGWALGDKPDVSDADITAMAIQGLTPYYATRSDVKAAVDRGVAWLSKAQTTDGGYTSWGSVNSESIAQVIVALTSLGIDPDSDSRFIKNEKSPIDALLSFAAPSGGFYHIHSGDKGNGGANPGEVDLMATDQALYALVAYERFMNGQTRLYDMTDIK